MWVVSGLFSIPHGCGVKIQEPQPKGPTMNRLLSLASILVLTAACGGTASLADRSRDALPSKDSVAVGAPGAKSASTRGVGDPREPGRPTQQSRVGDGSFWALTTA